MAALADDVKVNLKLEKKDFDKAAQALLRTAQRLGDEISANMASPQQAAAALADALAGLNKRFGELKAAAVGAMQPVLLAVVPILDAAVAAATRAMQAFGRLAEWIFGGAYGFEKAAGQANDYGGALKKTGAAARKAKKDLAGFDELDVLAATAAGSGGEWALDGGAEQGLTVFSRLLEGMRAKLAEVLAYIKMYYGPALEAWGEAFDRVKRVVLDCVNVMREALALLWDTALKPLAAYILTDFVPGIVNAFSTVLAPVLADIAESVIQVFGENFAFACELAARAVQELLLPALEWVKQVFCDMMVGIEEAWNVYGVRILEAFEACNERLRELALAVYETIILPLVESIGEAVGWLWSEVLQPLWDKLMLLVGSVVELVLNLWENVLLPFFLWLVETFGPVVSELVSALLEVWTQFATGVGGLIGGLLDALTGFVEFLSGVFTGDWERAWQGLGSIVEGVWNGVGDFVKGIVNTILAMINGMLQGVTTGINAVVRGINGISLTIPDWVPGLGGKTIGFSLGEVAAPQIPYLAKGAVIPPNREFMAVLGDQKSGTNIEAPEGLIRQLLREELSELGGGDINIRFTGSLSQLARVLQPEIEKEGARRGTALVTGG